MVQELLWAAGELNPKLDLTANQIYQYYAEFGALTKPKLGALCFYGMTEKVTHVAFMLDENLILEAGDGGSDVTSFEEAQKQNAFIKVRHYEHRKDLVAIIFPKYEMLKIDQWKVEAVQEVNLIKTLIQGEQMPELKQLQVSVPKEAEELLTAIVGLVAGLKRGDPAAVIIGTLLPQLMEGVKGVEQIPAELKTHRKEMMVLAGKTVGELLDVLMGPASA